MSTTMLYKCPGPHHVHGGKFDHKIVPDAEIAAAVADGWFLTTPEAKAAYEAAKAKPEPDAAPTHDELVQKAGEIGLTVDKRWSDARLTREIDAKLKA